MPRLQSAISRLNFEAMSLNLKLFDQLGLPVISTARPFSFYRKIFFDNRSETEVLRSLHGKTVVDVGCGLTPYTADSMFQACHRHDVSFFGIDPKLEDGFKFGPFDAAKAIMTGATHLPKPDMPGLNKAIAAYADALPFENGEVDLVLSSWLLFAWIQDPLLLEKIFREFDRVLKPGGRVSLYPTLHWQHIRQKYPQMAEVVKHYRREQQFSVYVRSGSLPFSYITHLCKP